MLSPLWDLPIARRGAVSLKADELNAIFDPSHGDQFEALLAGWQAKMTAPAFGKRRAERKAKAATSRGQTELF